MANRPGKETTGKRHGGTTAPKGGSTGGRLGGAPTARPKDRDRAASAGAGPGRSATSVPQAEAPQLEREDSETGTVRRSTGPRRVLIFARTLKEATAIAQRKKYPRELWRFVTGPADTDVDPREWATITVVGFGKDRPLAKDAYDDFQARCRGYGIRVPSYDP